MSSDDDSHWSWWFIWIFQNYYQYGSNELLKYGLHQSFRDKFKHIKRNIAVEFEALSSKLDPFVNDDSKENFHEYLRSVTNIMSISIYGDKDNTC